MKFEEALKRLRSFLAMKHPTVQVEDLEPISTPGYFQIVNLCEGLAGGCREPMHAALFCNGPTKHTVYFADHGRRDEVGRFISPFVAWRAIRSQQPPEIENPKARQ